MALRSSSRRSFEVVGLALVVLLAVSAKPDRQETLSYFAALDPDPVGRELHADDQARSGCAWVDGTFETFAGIGVPVRSGRDPLWTLKFSEIRSVNIHEAIPSPGIVRTHSYVFVQLELNEEARRRVDPIRKESCGSFVVVRQGDRDLDLAPLRGTGSHLLPGGSFESREDAEHFYRSIEERVSYLELSAKNREYWKSRNQELVEIAVWYAKCDPEYLKSLGDGLYEEILATPDLEKRMERVRCESGPPQISNPSSHE